MHGNQISNFQKTPALLRAPSSHDRTILSSKRQNNRLPVELLILNRYGVGYPYLSAAWSLAQKHKLNPLHVLIKAGIISEEIWLDSQHLLAKERAKKRYNHALETHLLDQSVNNLHHNLPFYSAKKTLTVQQKFSFLLAAVILGAMLYFNQQGIIFVIIMLFYTASILLRGFLLAGFGNKPQQDKTLISVDDNDLPTYSVLVALYKEKEQIEALTQSLWQLDWPKHKLDIKLICEADDHETITAIVDARLPKCFELVKVPPANPRTKPKALNFALPLCKGEYLVLYDAEDKPSPGQLREAYTKFSTGNEELACLQAPLHIHNYKQNWLTRMFAIEYFTLFNGILPVLEKWKVPIPLGGTSNHFNGVR